MWANGGELDEASAKSVARKPQWCYGAEPHQKGGPDLEGCTSCELYKKHLMNNDLERDGASAKSVAREPRGLYEAGVFQKYCINLHSTVLQKKTASIKHKKATMWFQ